MRVYQIARELERPHRAMLQLLRELGHDVPSHMARLSGDQEVQLREAIERQERGAPAVRPAHTASQSVSAAKVASVVGTIDLTEDTEWDSKTGAPPRPAATGTSPARTGPAPVRRRGPARDRRPGINREELADRISREAQEEGLEMVVDEDLIGPPLPTEGLVAETGVLRTVDLTALEDAPAAKAPPPTERPRRVRTPRRHVRALTRRRRVGPKVSIQASQNLAVTIPITMKELSQVFGVQLNEMMKRMFATTKDFSININSKLDEEQVGFLAEEFQRTVTLTTQKDAEEKLEDLVLEREVQNAGDASTRAPVIAILGHVDHGKTSLLDKIRDAHVADKEHGGITQHIGAFQVQTKDGHAVTFLDTPGHAAFTSMRARGAQVADIVVLVVAADDGVMPQTEEAINHAKVAEVPIVVAVNKIDKDNAKVEKVIAELAAHGLQAEEWGGDTQVIKVSAHTGEGLDTLLEALALQAEMGELMAHPELPARGHVIEARKDPNRGVICTLLVAEGTLRRGDTAIAGLGMGRVRRMQDEKGRLVKEAPPSTPVEVFGLAEPPDAGETFLVVNDKLLAKETLEGRRRRDRDANVRERPQVTLATIFGDGAEDQAAELKIILKADVRGSLEPIRNELQKLDHPEVKVNLLYAGLGAVTQSDVDNAIVANAVIIGFHVLTEPAAKKEAERQKVEIRPYMMIYEVVDDIKAAMENLLTPERREEVTGHAEIRQIFSSSKLGNLSGCYVIDGTIGRDEYIRLYRGGKLLYGDKKTAQVDSLKRFKDDVKEVREGFECGIRISAYQDVKEGDVIEFYALREIKRSLDG